MPSSKGWALGAGMEVEPRAGLLHLGPAQPAHPGRVTGGHWTEASMGRQAEMWLQCGCHFTGRRETQLQLGSHHGPAELFQQWFLTALTEGQRVKCGLSPKGRA